VERRAKNNPRPAPERAAQRHQRIVAEARDLVEDRPRSCELCRRRMRYWPDGEKTTQRAFGRYFSWRCDLCFFVSDIVVAALAGHTLSPVQVLRGRLIQAEALTAHLDELMSARADELLDAAMDELCRQLQLVGEQVHAASLAIVHGRNIVLYADMQLGKKDLAGRYIPWTPHPPAPAQA
jgi:hypothetical protein